MVRPSEALKVLMTRHWLIICYTCTNPLLHLCYTCTTPPLFLFSTSPLLHLYCDPATPVLSFCSPSVTPVPQLHWMYRPWPWPGPAPAMRLIYQVPQKRGLHPHPSQSENGFGLARWPGTCCCCTLFPTEVKTSKIPPVMLDRLSQCRGVGSGFSWSDSHLGLWRKRNIRFFSLLLLLLLDLKPTVCWLIKSFIC